MRKAYIIVMCILGIGLVAGGLAYQKKLNDFMATATQIEAKITNITEGGTRKNRTHNVYVEFYLKRIVGEPWRIETTVDYHYSMQIGDSITVYYNPQDPYEARTKLGRSEAFISHILIGSGLIIIVAVLLRTFISKRRKERLMGLNCCVIANVTGINQKIPLLGAIFSRSDKELCQLCLQYSHNGKDYKAYSPYLLLSKTGFPVQMNVYIDPNKPKVYYVNEDDWANS